MKLTLTYLLHNQNHGDYAEDVRNRAAQDKGSPSECFTMPAFPFVHFEMKLGLQRTHRQGTCYPQTKTLTLPPFPAPPPLHLLPFIPPPSSPSSLPPPSLHSSPLLPFIPPPSPLHPSPLLPFIPPLPTHFMYVCACVHGYIHAYAFEQDLSQSSIHKSRTWSARQPDVTTE